jgi:hypothetical protein
MTPSRGSLLRRAARGAALVLIVAVASVVLRTAPSEAQWQAPIEVRGQLGDRVEGRNIAATVEDVRIARSVTASTGWIGETTGVWVVVDVQAEAVVTEVGALLATAELVLGEDAYSASTRPGLGTLAGQSLAVGVPREGPLMFEVPSDAVTSAVAADALLRLAIARDPRTDSMLVVPVDLSGVDAEEAVTTSAPGQATR